MKKTFQKIASLLLAFLVILSTVSFTVEKHYCGEFLVDVAVFSDLKDCGMDIMSFSDTQETTLKKMSCCKDEVIVFKGQNGLKLSFDQLGLSSQSYIPSCNYPYTTISLIPQEKHMVFKEYAPPERIYDIIILYETFLI